VRASHCSTGIAISALAQTVASYNAALEHATAGKRSPVRSPATGYVGGLAKCSVTGLRADEHIDAQQQH